ncbi:unnamed protein product [Rotaria socialis]|uniref:Uncharacterized protein n=1 Tax=Rotaria socialis TaxID=392032 RepID=A0A820FW41_9BILA|nr:unnamed protein product [Rotaria socialis]CAF3550014.1 unnamed protein product [Rotaria socialis]CAF4270039.1 unnamed protein product [Rotaria socialis]CAF4420847.1 unnamed protein product [Rotaria socialis]
MSSVPFIALSDQPFHDTVASRAIFVQIHLDKEFYAGDKLKIHPIVSMEGEMPIIQENCIMFGDPDSYIDFISSLEWRKVFFSLTEDFSYLLSLIHDLPQIVYIYIYSTSPMNVFYYNTAYLKFRAFIGENSPDADKQLLRDIEMFRRDLTPINVMKPISRKTRLLIQE